MWQDTVIMILQFVIAGALIPTVVNKHKPASITSIIDGSALACLVFVFCTMQYWWSAFGAAVSAALWFVLLYQVIQIKRRRKRSAK